MPKNTYGRSFIIVSGMALTLLVATPAFASRPNMNGQGHTQGIHKVGNKTNSNNKKEKIPGVYGTVTSVNGSTLTVTSKDNVVYTIDASNAKILKEKNNTMTIGEIQNGDLLAVKGQISGTNVSATVIHDGLTKSHRERHGKFPGVTGTVTAVNGNTITMTNENGTVYAVDVTSAILQKGELNSKPSVIQITDIQNGDTVMVNGEVSGTNVVARRIFDGKFKVRLLNN